jgi:hypothetical protein
MLNLLVVLDIKVTETESIILFTDGQKGKLKSSDEFYRYYMRLAEKSYKRQYPVAVTMVEPDQIIEMARADNDYIEKIIDHDSRQIMVFFQGHDGIFFLQKDHLEFSRVYGLLEQSMKDDSRVWFIANKPNLNIIDVMKVEN